MAWNDSAPTKEEISWDSSEPDIEENKPQVGQLETAVRHGLGGFSYGFADEAEAALRAAYDYASSGEDFIKKYRQIKDDINTREKAGAEQNPGTALASSLAGGLLAPVRGSGIKTALGMGKFGAAIAKGGIAGGLYGAGTANTLGDMPEEIAKGGAIGGAIGGVLHPVSSQLEKFFTKEGAEKVMEKALAKKNKQVFKSSGLSEKGTGTLLLKTDETGALTNKFTQESVGDWIEKHGVEQWASEPKRFEAVNMTVNKLGKEKDAVLGQLDELAATKIYPIQNQTQQITDNFLVGKNNIKVLLGQLKKDIPLKDAMEIDTFKTAYDRIIEKMDLVKTATIAPSELNDIIKSLGNITNFDKIVKKSKVSFDVWKTLKEIQTKQAEKLNPDLAQKLTGLNDDLHVGLVLKKGFEKNAAKSLEAENAPSRIAGLTSTSVASAATKGMHGVNFLIGAVGISKFLDSLPKRYYSYQKGKANIFGNLQKKLSKISPTSKRILDAAAQRGTNAVISADFLLKQSDEKYRKLMEEKEDEI